VSFAWGLAGEDFDLFRLGIGRCEGAEAGLSMNLLRVAWVPSAMRWGRRFFYVFFFFFFFFPGFRGPEVRGRSRLLRMVSSFVRSTNEGRCCLGSRRVFEGVEDETLVCSRWWRPMEGLVEDV